MKPLKDVQTTILEDENTSTIRVTCNGTIAIITSCLSSDGMEHTAIIRSIEEAEFLFKSLRSIITAT